MRIAIKGTGQLARMMALAGWPLGYSFAFFGSKQENTSCIEGLGDIIFLEDHADIDSLYDALGKPDVITVEKEEVDTTLLRKLQQHCPIYPDPDVIDICRHRGKEKNWINEQGIPTANYRVTANRDDIIAALNSFSSSAILKTCSGGYDGYNQWRLKTEQDIQGLDDSVCVQDCVMEEMVNFSTEVSVIAARNSKGEVAVYPVTENYHRRGTLLISEAPAPDLSEELEAEAQRMIATLLNASNYVGVLAMECFVTENGLVVNELAPRVHNSGHWTMNAGIASQFENHLRAITGMPLGNTKPAKAGGMVNLLGVDVTAKDALGENTYLHLYNKSVKPNRKMGHINLQADDSEPLKAQLNALAKQVYGDDI
ncbi:MAG: 5-(carboxyamino)imidazole ribonucleotide synthase [Oceanospirillum sp.]|nr:5-(carboxyamino)imidazole ribonucleotide synthase [Oceanospirillum sp.]